MGRRSWEIKDDRERIMMTIMMEFNPWITDCQWGGEPGTFCYWAKPEPGDLVQCQTQRTPNHWCWAWLVEHKDDRPDGSWLLRELGGEQTCYMHNEMLRAFRGINPERLLEGHQHKFYRKAVKAFSGEGVDYLTRFGGIAWPDRHSKTATFGVRPHVWAMKCGAPKDQRYVVDPVPITMTYNSRTTIKSIAAEITALGDIDWEARTKLVEGGGGRLTTDVVAA